MLYRLTPVVCAAVLLAAPASASNQEVLDAIDEARAAYDEGDLAYAKETLDFAAQLIAQEKAGQLADLLPQPLDGWQAGEVETTAVGASMFGGGTVVERDYNGDGGDLTVRLTADSPLLAQIAAMFANPAMISASGGEMLRLGRRQTAALTGDGTLQFLVENRIMVQIEGDAERESKIAYAEAIDLAALRDY